MRDTGVIRWRFIGDESLCRRLMGEARTLLGTLRATLGPGVTTGAMTRRMGPTSVVNAALYDGLPVVTIAASGGEELAKQEQAAIYFALFEMLRNATVPSNGTNQNSLLVKAAHPPAWYRDADDAAIYPSAKRYPSGIPEQHAWHQYADRRKGVTVTCGFGRIPYLTAPSRSVGVAVNGRLVTSDLAAVGGFSEDYCLSPRILSVRGDRVIFAFLCAPPSADMRLFLAAHNKATGVTTAVASCAAADVVVAHPAFGFYYSPAGDKCCGVVLALDGAGWLLKEIEFTIDIATPAITVAVTAPDFAYVSPDDYEAVVGCYYDADSIKTPVAMKPSSSTESTVTDAGVSYAGTVTFNFSIFDSTVDYSPPSSFTVEYASHVIDIDDVCFYRGDEKWLTLYKLQTDTVNQYSYASGFVMLFNTGGDLLEYGISGPEGSTIGAFSENTSILRLARLYKCDLEAGSYLSVETENDSLYEVPLIHPGYILMDSWASESVTETSEEVWAVSVSGLSSAAPRSANYDEETTTVTQHLRQGAKTKAGSLTVEADEDNFPANSFNYNNSNYSFALNSYIAQSSEYEPRRRIPPAYTSTEEANTPSKFADFFLQMLEYWGYNDRRIVDSETQSSGFTRYLTTEQYESHLIGMGALYELAGDKKPVSFAAFNTYSGIHVLLDGVDLSAGQPAGGSDTFIPAGVL